MHRIWALGTGLMLLVSPGWIIAGEVTVEVGHNRLEPAEITITEGDTVTFHNQGIMPGGHTLVGADKAFQSPPLADNQSWSHTFTKEGVYPYHIKQHPGAKGRVVVTKPER